MAILPKDTFIEVIKNTPLVSIDLIVRNDRQEVLLGLRNNQPAKNCWFVPGGIIRKNETMSAAFARISLTELGKEFARESAIFLGAFEHLYQENFAEAPGFGTHYIVLAHEIQLEDNLPTIPQDQHRESAWFSVDQLLNDPAVHPNTKAYFE
ncbi:MAG: GDP-mannose mannosyl hydrolase [Proteobacteria bacterium]|nr:GDP-mannose mannosyl hydrolase [Pseudomonadota bacterium]MBU1710350.1 GDP-mannose mannosyl hydrolase [Pseudomonadota bacterium]